MGDWCPGAEVIPSAHNGGSMTGGPSRFVVHTYEADPHRVSASAGAHSLIKAGNEVHLVFNPLTGDLAQILPASVAGRGLVNLPGGVQTNRMGDACIQVEVIAFANDPFTGYMTQAGWDTWATVMGWVESLGVARAWPAGGPPPSPNGPFHRSTSTWANESGLFGHSQVPENTHTDPGAVDAQRLATEGDSMALTVADADLIITRLLTWKMNTGWHEDGTFDPTDTTNQVTVAAAWTGGRGAALGTYHGEAPELVASFPPAGGGGDFTAAQLAQIRAECDAAIRAALGSLDGS